MSAYDINTLNEEQKRALSQIEGAVLVVAGAGSGKTRLLTHRIAHLICDKGVDPYNILAITFTNKAAKEMQNRVEDMLGQTQKVWISTFHSMCVKILRQSISHLEGYDKNFSIYSDTDTDRVLKQIFKEKNIDDDKVVKSASFHISNIKNNNFSPKIYAKENSYIDGIETIIEVYYDYEEHLKKNNALDFDDLLMKTYDLFAQNKDILFHYANRFRYILVDEFQDTNTVQYELVKMLASVHGNVFAVGDEDQCIYSWRGANFRNISSFQKDFSATKVFKLERNYRSTKKILELANTIIRNNTERVKKTLWTEKEEGTKIENYVAYDEREEAEFVAQKIKQLVDNQGYKYNDIAVLTRLNALTLPFEERFLAYSIPHKVFGGFKFFERAEIKNIIAYLRLFINQSDDISFLRVINFPKRGIGESAVTKLKELANENHCSLLNACLSLKSWNINTGVYQKFILFADVFSKLLEKSTSVTLTEFVIDVIKSFQLKSAYDITNTSDFDKIANIDQFISSCEEYETKNGGASLDEYLESVALISDLDSMEDGDNNVKIATIHSVKGLEFKVVFIVGLEEKIFPILRSSSSFEDMEEERRLMYVAITRAEERLFLSRARTRFLYGKRDNMLCSRFLTELGIETRAEMPYRTINDFENHTNTWYNKTAKVGQPFVASKIFDIPNTSSGEKVEIEDLRKYKIGQQVKHARFGNGIVLSINNEDKTAEILFEGFGKKTLLLEIAPLEIIG